MRVAAMISFAARLTSSVNLRVRKIGVSEIRKSAGHFSDSFTQRTSAEYFSGVKSALKAVRSFGSTVTTGLQLFAVPLFDKALGAERAGRRCRPRLINAMQIFS